MNIDWQADRWGVASVMVGAWFLFLSGRSVIPRSVPFRAISCHFATLWLSCFDFTSGIQIHNETGLF
jgi:hypothetical protein